MAYPGINPVYFFREQGIGLLLLRKGTLGSLSVLPDHGSVFVPKQILQIGFQVRFKAKIVHRFCLIIAVCPPVFVHIRVRASIAIGGFLYRFADPDPLADAALFQRQRFCRSTAARTPFSILPDRILPGINQADPLHKAVFSANSCLLI